MIKTAFLEADLKNIDLVYCFEKSSLEKALRDWRDEQIEAFPEKEEQIQTVALAMMDFMYSRHVVNHGLVVHSSLKRRYRSEARL